MTRIRFEGSPRRLLGCAVSQLPCRSSPRNTANLGRLRGVSIAASVACVPRITGLLALRAELGSRPGSPHRRLRMALPRSDFADPAVAHLSRVRSRRAEEFGFPSVARPRTSWTSPSPCAGPGRRGDRGPQESRVSGPPARLPPFMGRERVPRARRYRESRWRSDPRLANVAAKRPEKSGQRRNIMAAVARFTLGLAWPRVRLGGGCGDDHRHRHRARRQAVPRRLRPGEEPQDEDHHQRAVGQRRASTRSRICRPATTG